MTLPHLALLALAALAAGGPAARTGAAPQGPGAEPQAALSMPLFQKGAVAEGWTDLGWVPRKIVPGQPAKLDFSSPSGWILSHDPIKPANLGGLFIRLRAAQQLVGVLEVKLDSGTRASFPGVLANTVRRDDGWADVWLSMEALDPRGIPFDRVVLRALQAVPGGPVEVEAIGFTAERPPGDRVRAIVGPPPRAATVTLDCRRTHPINPLVYGVAFGDEKVVWDLGASARRWGGNPTTRFNWNPGSAWNAGHDWFFRNGPSDQTWQRFLEDDRAHGVTTAFTVPMIGWVAKDTSSCGFPVATFGPQKRVDPYHHDCGNGESPAGEPLPPGSPTATSVRSSPESAGAWVRAIRELDPSPRSARLFFLDNEPTLWHVNHRDVHPERVSYDELIERTIAYGSAIKSADPDARVAGFVSWGWTALFFSAADKAEGHSFVPSDRLAHGGKQFLPWWLSQLRAYEKKRRRRLVDTVDVHFYPQGEGMGLYGEGLTDLDTSVRRIRSVRALWDPSYTDESWIAEPQRLIPRLKEWIAAEDPGLGISIGEYNFGAENHVSGGLAVAEALGRFGEQGVEAAFYWPLPPRNSAAYWAFRAFRNYDGEGAKAGNDSVHARLSDQGLSSVFATRREDGTLVLVALNEEPAKPMDLGVDPGSCGRFQLEREFSFTGVNGLAPVRKPSPPPRIHSRLAPWSIHVLELKPAAR